MLIPVKVDVMVTEEAKARGVTSYIVVPVLVCKSSSTINHLADRF